MGATVLITGGRAPAALDLARKFSRSGARVVVAESVSAQLCGHSRAVARVYRVPPPNREPDAFAESLADIVKRENVDLVVPTCEEIFYVSRGLDRLPCTVLAPPLDVLRQLHSKWDFIQLARTLALPVPETRLISSAADFSDMPRPFVLKPVFSRFGTQVHLVTADPPTVDLSRQWVAQELLVGQQICTYSVAADGQLLAHAAYATEFTAGPGACIAFEPVENPEIDSWVRTFVKGTGANGQLAFDFIVNEAGEALPLECNPRATSGVHLLDDRLTDVMLGVVSAEVLRPVPEARAMISMAMLSFGLASVRSRAGLRRWFSVFRTSADVIAVAGDRRPFWSQFAVLGHNLWQSVRTRRSPIECSTSDIAWDGS
jgi:hypothetical protein